MRVRRAERHRHRGLERHRVRVRPVDGAQSQGGPEELGLRARAAREGRRPHVRPARRLRSLRDPRPRAPGARARRGDEAAAHRRRSRRVRRDLRRGRSCPRPSHHAAPHRHVRERGGLHRRHPRGPHLAQRLGGARTRAHGPRPPRASTIRSAAPRRPSSSSRRQRSRSRRSPAPRSRSPSAPAWSRRASRPSRSTRARASRPRARNRGTTRSRPDRWRRIFSTSEEGGGCLSSPIRFGSWIIGLRSRTA